MAAQLNQLNEKLAGIVGEKNVTEQAYARRKYASDEYWYAIAANNAGQPLSRPDVAVKPASTEQVAEIVKLANELKVPITPWGGGSGVQGAANADRGGIVMDLRGMKRVRQVDEKSLTAVVEAGKNVKELEEELNEKGLAFTHYPASAEWATIGGCIGARGSGVLIDQIRQDRRACAECRIRHTDGRDCGIHPQYHVMLPGQN